MMVSIFRHKGLFSLTVTTFLAVTQIPVLKTLPTFSVLFGFIGSFLITLSIENAAANYLSERELVKNTEVRNLVVDWPAARISFVETASPTLWQLLRPIIISDLLWRNSATIRIDLRA